MVFWGSGEGDLNLARRKLFAEELPSRMQCLSCGEAIPTLLPPAWLFRG